MKILLYNFALPGDGNPATGGVGVYMSSLAKALLARGDDVVLLSSGSDYSPWRREPMIAFSKKHGFECAKIINSPVIAPSHDNFFATDVYLSSAELNTFPALIRKRYGSLDVLHFQNIEGLTLGFFKAAREAFPSAKILFSAHNYNLVCPQVNLWKRERVNCTDYKNGHACVTCIPFRTAEFRKRVRAAWWMRTEIRYLPSFIIAYLLRRRGLPDGNEIHQFRKLEPGMSVLKTAEMARGFRAYRSKNVELASKSFDSVLAVSDRTRQVLLNHGLEPDNVVTSYIGSMHVKTKAAGERRVRQGDGMHIAYLGYIRRDKGFDFLLRALEKLPEETARLLTVTIAARLYDEHIIERIGLLGLRLAAVNLINGYNSSEIATLLHDVDLGVIPPIWEDNLPQVAIELVANGIPILTSDAGGASEIANNKDFIFAAGSISGFTKAIQRFLSNEVSLASFWSKEPNIRDFDAHLRELTLIYNGENPSLCAAAQTI